MKMKKKTVLFFLMLCFLWVLPIGTLLAQNVLNNFRFSDISPLLQGTTGTPIWLGQSQTEPPFTALLTYESFGGSKLYVKIGESPFQEIFSDKKEGNVGEYLAAEAYSKITLQKNIWLVHNQLMFSTYDAYSYVGRKKALWRWDPLSGLEKVIQTGDQAQTAGGVQIVQNLGFSTPGIDGKSVLAKLEFSYQSFNAVYRLRVGEKPQVVVRDGENGNDTEVVSIQENTLGLFYGINRHEPFISRIFSIKNGRTELVAQENSPDADGDIVWGWGVGSNLLIASSVMNDEYLTFKFYRITENGLVPFFKQTDPFEGISHTLSRKSVGVAFFDFVLFSADGPDGKALGYWTWDGPDETQVKTAVRVGDVVLENPVVELDYLNQFPAITSGCGDFSFIDGNRRWLRAQKPCLQEAPTTVQSGQEIALYGSNFLLGENPVVKVLFGGVAIDPVVSSDSEIRVKAPAYGGDYEVRVQLSFPSGKIVSNHRKMKVEGGIPPAELKGVGSVTGKTGGPSSLGDFVSLYGTNLSGMRIPVGTFPLPSASAPYPNRFGKVEVLIGGQVCPVQFAVTWAETNESQINCQLPYELPLGQKVQVVVHRLNDKGEVEAVSNQMEIQISTIAPKFFGNDEYPVFMQNTTQDPTGGTFVSQKNPAHPGDWVTVYGVGFGSVDDPTLKAGELPKRLSKAEVQVQVEVIQNLGDGQFKWAGFCPVYGEGAFLSPEFPGLYQLTFQFPTNLSSENYLLRIKVGEMFFDFPVWVAEAP